MRWEGQLQNKAHLYNYGWPSQPSWAFILKLFTAACHCIMPNLTTLADSCLRSLQPCQKCQESPEVLPSLASYDATVQYMGDNAVVYHFAFLVWIGHVYRSACPERLLTHISQSAAQLVNSMGIKASWNNLLQSL